VTETHSNNPISTERLLQFATLTEAEARHLHGKRIKVLVELDSPAWEDGGFLGFECVSADVNSRTLLLDGRDESCDLMIVEGMLRVFRHPPSADGAFPGFVEYRLVNARRFAVR